DDMPETEKWRIINESGLLGKEIPIPGAKPRKTQPPSPMDGEDFIFRAVLYTIPFTTLYVLLHSLVFKQYGEVLGLVELISQASKAAPILAIFIYYTNARRDRKLIQTLFIALCIFCGSYMLYLVEKSPALGIMRQAPGLATLWIYAIFMLDLTKAMISLAVVGAYY
ncbi:hypothetical protein BJ684DRAFT_1172, partial [Piptocephalis cylindrospora]